MLFDVFVLLSDEIFGVEVEEWNQLRNEFNDTLLAYAFPLKECRHHFMYGQTTMVSAVEAGSMGALKLVLFNYHDRR